jgi:dephospho-CoA kinase
MDAVAVVSAPLEVQRERVLQREGMTPERLDAILSHQMPDAEKRARADFIIDTGNGLEPVRKQVAEIIAIMRDPLRRPEPKANALARDI